MIEQGVYTNLSQIDQDTVSIEALKYLARFFFSAVLVTFQAQPQALHHQILPPCFIADLPHFPDVFLKYNRGKLQYGSFSYPPSKNISLQMRVLPVICHNIDFAWGVEGCDTLD